MKRSLIKIIITAVAFIFVLLLPSELLVARNIFLVAIYLFIGFDILRETVQNIKQRDFFDENSLMTIATLGAICIGEFPEAVAVMLFYSIGELFEHYAVDKSRKSIASLMDIRPDYANLIINSKTASAKKDSPNVKNETANVNSYSANANPDSANVKKVHPSEVKVNQIILVRPGEKIPLDGKIIEGNSSLDTKALTGESVPRDANLGDKVLSGCVNLTGILKIRVTKPYSESTASKILELVEHAEEKKAPAENFITKFARIYTPVVVLIAVILAIIPPIANLGDFSTWLYRGWNCPR